MGQEKKETLLLELLNKESDAKKLWLEPWCEEFELPEGAAWRLTAVGEICGSPMVTVEFQEDVVVVWGVPDVVMRVYLNGEMIWECFEPFQMPG